MGLFGFGSSSNSRVKGNFGLSRSGRTLWGKNGKLGDRVDKYLNNWKVRKELRTEEGLSNFEQRKLREALKEGIGEKTHVTDYEFRKILEKNPNLRRVLKGETPRKAGREILEEIDEVDGKASFNSNKYGGTRKEMDNYADEDWENN